MFETDQNSETSYVCQVWPAAGCVYFCRRGRLRVDSPSIQNTKQSNHESTWMKRMPAYHPKLTQTWPNLTSLQLFERKQANRKAIVVPLSLSRASGPGVTSPAQTSLSSLSSSDMSEMPWHACAWILPGTKCFLGFLSRTISRTRNSAHFPATISRIQPESWVLFQIQ